MSRLWIPFSSLAFFYLLGLALCIFFVSAKTPNLVSYIGASLLLFSSCAITVLYVAVFRHQRSFSNDPQLWKDPIFLSMASGTFLSIIASILFLLYFTGFCSANLHKCDNPETPSSCRKPYQYLDPGSKECRCAKGFDLDPKTQECVCPLGFHISNNQCLPGCGGDDKNCPKGNVCASGTCCDTSTHEKIENECCPKGNVHQVGVKKVCCPLQCAKECCLSKDDFVCSSDGLCQTKCGNMVCNSDTEVCIQYPKSLEDEKASSGELASMCVPKNNQCKMNVSHQNYPAISASQGIFYPAYDANIDDSSKVIDTMLNAIAPDDPKVQQAIQTINDSATNKDKKGYMCGLNAAFGFQSTPIQNCTDTSYCLNTVIYPKTVRLQIKKDEKGGLVCNQLLDFNAETPEYSKMGSEPDVPEGSFYTTLETRKEKDLVSLQREKKFFSTSLGPPRGVVNNCAVGTVSYQKDCQVFNSCKDTKTCPFSADEFECVYESDPDRAYIQDKQSPSNQCTAMSKDQGGTLSYGCTRCDDEKCTNATTNVQCSNAPNDCSQVKSDPPTDLENLSYYAGDFDSNDTKHLEAVKCNDNLAPVFRLGGLYGSHDEGCSHPSFKNDIIYQCCDKIKFQQDLDQKQVSHDDLVLNHPDPSDGLFRYCTPPKIYTIKNMGEATDGHCHPSNPRAYNTGCGSRSACRGVVKDYLVNVNKRSFSAKE